MCSYIFLWLSRTGGDCCFGEHDYGGRHARCVKRRRQEGYAPHTSNSGMTGQTIEEFGVRHETFRFLRFRFGRLAFYRSLFEHRSSRLVAIPSRRSLTGKKKKNVRALRRPIICVCNDLYVDCGLMFTYAHAVAHKCSFDVFSCTLGVNVQDYLKRKLS